jgi:hypothetical protein
MCRIMHACERLRSLVCLQQVVCQISNEMFDIIYRKCDEASVKQPDNAVFVLAARLCVHVNIPVQCFWGE